MDFGGVFSRAGNDITPRGFPRLMNDDMARYAQHITLLSVNPATTDFAGLMNGYAHSMMGVAIKQVYGIVVWISGSVAVLFMLLDIPAVRTNVRKVPLWPVYGIELLSRLTFKSKRVKS